MYKELAPAAVHQRWQDLQCHQGAYITPGPNFIWSIDGYLKLALYGIEIYAAIDARLVKPRVGAGFQAYLIRPRGFWGGLPSQ